MKMNKTQKAFAIFLFDLFYNGLERQLSKYRESLGKSAENENTPNIEIYYKLIQKTRKKLKVMENTTPDTFLKGFILALIKEDPEGG